MSNKSETQNSSIIRTWNRTCFLQNFKRLIDLESHKYTIYFNMSQYQQWYSKYVKPLWPTPPPPLCQNAPHNRNKHTRNSLWFRCEKETGNTSITNNFFLPGFIHSYKTPQDFLLPSTPWFLSEQPLALPRQVSWNNGQWDDAVTIASAPVA